MNLPSKHFNGSLIKRLSNLRFTTLIFTIIVASSSFAADPKANRYAEQQIKITQARPAAPKKVIDADAGAVAAKPATPQRQTTQKQNTQQRQSILAKAATGQALDELPPKPLDGSLVSGKVVQAGYFESHPTGGCDCVGPVCACGDAVCGVEPFCGTEAVCGLEPACGCDMSIGCSCGVEAGCGLEMMPGCGTEVSCGMEVGCGMEPMVDCGCDACAGVMTDDCYPLLLPILRINWCRYDLFAGVHSFTGPMNYANVSGTGGDRVGSGSFGFYEGFNEGRSLKRWLGWDLAGQFGVRATQSNLFGAEFTDETRNQIFVTGGLFRRVDYGLQYGFVVDYLNDDWYFQGDLTQIRGELSWNTGRCHIFGYQIAAGMSDDRSATVVRTGAGATVNGTVSFEATDQHRLFYRRTLKGNGSWSAFGGWTDREDGLLGALLNLPLRQKVVLQTGATFLIPNQGANTGGNEEESWNLSLGLVFRPGGPEGCGRYCRPLFDVADNGTFMIDRR